MHESEDNAFLVEVGVPIPIFNRNQGAILEARHRLAKVDEERRAVEVGVRLALGVGYEALMSAFEEATALGSRVIPEARQAFDTVGDGYRKGLFGYLDVLDAQRTLFELRSRYIDALADYHRAAADVERLIGEPMRDIERR